MGLFQGEKMLLQKFTGSAPYHLYLLGVFLSAFSLVNTHNKILKSTNQALSVIQED